GVRVRCDRERILQVFGNLLGNAIKFCEPGDVVTVGARAERGCVWFTVSDTGPGIAPHELAHVFEPYWSGEKYEKKGTGLGLFITKGIVDAHGGTIRVDSAPGAGATFTFTLPIVR